MPVILERKPFKVGDSIAVSLPVGHTMRDEEQVMMIANNVVLIYPKGMVAKDVREHVKELAGSIKDERT